MIMVMVINEMMVIVTSRRWWSRRWWSCWSLLASLQSQPSKPNFSYVLHSFRMCLKKPPQNKINMPIFIMKNLIRKYTINTKSKTCFSPIVTILYVRSSILVIYILLEMWPECQDEPFHVIRNWLGNQKPTEGSCVQRQGWSTPSPENEIWKRWYMIMRPWW